MDRLSSSEYPRLRFLRETTVSLGRYALATVKRTIDGLLSVLELPETSTTVEALQKGAPLTREKRTGGFYQTRRQG